MPKDKTRKPRHTDAQVIAALQSSAGVMAHAARKLGLTRSTLHKRVHGDPGLMEAWTETMESNLDLAESKLLSAINNGELNAVFFFLKCRGKKRGYVERHEFDYTDAPAPIAINIRVVDEEGRAIGN